MIKKIDDLKYISNRFLNFLFYTRLPMLSQTRYINYKFLKKENLNKFLKKEDLNKFLKKEDLNKFLKKEDLNKFLK